MIALSSLLCAASLISLTPATSIRPLEANGFAASSSETASLQEVKSAPDPTKMVFTGGKTTQKIVKKLLSEGFQFLGFVDGATSLVEFTETYWKLPGVEGLFEVDLYPVKKEPDELMELSCIVLLDLKEPLAKAKSRQAELEKAALTSKIDLDFEFDEVKGEPGITRLTISHDEVFDIVPASAEDQGTEVSARFAAMKKVIASLKPISSTPNPPAFTPERTDPIGKILKAASISSTDIGDFYKVRFDFTDTKRSQTAYVRKSVYTYNSLSVQECYTLIYDRAAPPDTDLIRSLFQKSFTLGGLVLEAPTATQTNWRIRFRCEIPTQCPPDRVRNYIELIAISGDVFEKELGPEDRL